jgi:hypothetical protein
MIWPILLAFYLVKIVNGPIGVNMMMKGNFGQNWIEMTRIWPNLGPNEKKDEKGTG